MICSIVAMGENREIGSGNKLLWRLPKDMQFFQDTTMGGIVIMGRKTWDSIPSSKKPLKGRVNIVITSGKKGSEFLGGQHVYYMDAKKARDYIQKVKHMDVFIMGGEQIYNVFADLVNIMYITYVESKFPQADTFFPSFNVKEWKRNTLRMVMTEEYPYIISKYTRKGDEHIV